MISQEDRPLATLRNFRRLTHNIGDRKPIFLGDCHIHAWHQGEVECHVAFIAVAEIVAGILWPLIGLGKQHLARVSGIERCTDLLQDFMRLWQVLVDCPLALDQIRDCVQSETIDSGFQPASASRLEAAFSTSGLSKLRSGWWE